MTMRGVRVRRWAPVAAAALIGVATLRPGGGGMDWTGFCLVCGARGLADVIANVILFIPLGAAAGYGGWSLVRTVLVGAAFSGCIEMAQIELVTGRDANVGDLLANTAGSLAGWALFRVAPWRWAGSVGRLITVSVAAATAVVLTGVLFLMAPSLPAGPYRVAWTPVYENHDVFGGRVLSAAARDDGAGEMPLRDGRLVRWLEGKSLHVRFVAARAPDRLAPILALHQGETEVQLLGAYGTDLVYRYWAHADALRLDHADLRLPDVLADAAVGDTVDLAFSFGAAGYCLRSGATERCGGGFTAGDTWSILVSPDMSRGRRTALGITWLVLVFLPTGFVARNRCVALAGGAVTSTLLIGIPLVTSLSVTPWWEVLAACIGVAAGRLVAGATRRGCQSGPPTTVERRDESRCAEVVRSATPFPRQAPP